MANKEIQKTPKPLKEDSLVEQLVPDPNDLQPRVQLTGWVGKSTKEGFWRLYLTPQLNEYLEFSDQDVMHTQSLQAEQSPLGGTTVWFRPGTIMRHCRLAARQVQVDFLSGAITSGFMSGTVASFPPAATRQQAAVGTAGYQCSANPHIPVCQSNFFQCITQACSGTAACTGELCPTNQGICAITQIVGCYITQGCNVVTQAPGCTF
jgi:hypothetical protein